MRDLRDRITKPIAHLQAEIGCDSYSWLWKVLSGRVLPSVALAKKIQAATGGAILWTEFFEDPPGHEGPSSEEREAS